MAEDATICLAFGTVGLVPDGGLCWIMHRAFGYRQALQAIIERRKIGAAESVRRGLANAMFPEASLTAETHALAEVISASAPLAVAAAKRLLRRMDSISLSEAVFAEAVEQTALVRSADCAEGVAAFRERRRPVFRGA